MTHAQRQAPSAPSKSSRKSGAAYELSLETMLADEIVKLTMASDGVTADEVRALARITPLHKAEARPE